MTWIDVLTLIGSIGLFLYGLKLMSEGLQKIAGDSLRKVLAAMNSNRFTGMLVGILVTALVQSSSATTVMIVSFANAGMISLAQSMSVIMGAPSWSSRSLPLPCRSSIRAVAARTHGENSLSASRSSSSALRN